MFNLRKLDSQNDITTMETQHPAIAKHACACAYVREAISVRTSDGSASTERMTPQISPQNQSHGLVNTNW